METYPSENSWNSVQVVYTTGVVEFEAFLKLRLKVVGCDFSPIEPNTEGRTLSQACPITDTKLAQMPTATACEG